MAERLPRHRLARRRPHPRPRYRTPAGAGPPPVPGPAADPAAGRVPGVRRSDLAPGLRWADDLPFPGGAGAVGPGALPPAGPSRERRSHRLSWPFIRPASRGRHTEGPKCPANTYQW